MVTGSIRGMVTSGHAHRAYHVVSVHCEKWNWNQAIWRPNVTGPAHSIRCTGHGTFLYGSDPRWLFFLSFFLAFIGCADKIGLIVHTKLKADVLTDLIITVAECRRSDTWPWLWGTEMPGLPAWQACFCNDQCNCARSLLQTFPFQPMNSTYSTKVLGRQGWLVSWCFEPSQLRRITSGLNTNFTLSPSHSFHKSLYHKSFLHHPPPPPFCYFIFVQFFLNH